MSKTEFICFVLIPIKKSRKSPKDNKDPKPSPGICPCLLFCCIKDKSDKFTQSEFTN